MLYGAIHMFTVPLSKSTYFHNRCRADIEAEVICCNIIAISALNIL
jgi:hypothetical protein